VKLEETAELIGDLQKAQSDRLGLPTFPVPPYTHPPTDHEVELANRITNNLTEMAKQANPGSLVSSEALHKAMGINLDAATFQSVHQTNFASSGFTGKPS